MKAKILRFSGMQKLDTKTSWKIKKCVHQNWVKSGCKLSSGQFDLNIGFG